ncbi:hypothetical protein SH580_19335 [Coraliomargarita algicola]|uniref:Autotransporter-associated beta strand repeat protein n=1 Tax=Coraliomargarita algicola TaxID=3092156 RepID=A0ABZ0RKP1_9BACT|nr:hypothetical protein [Coraliomargarita sp. J2-16]WPJ95575.1 hypothetical protein SH580_19335 [Coraliomargarita sp. J2-16]
MAATLLAPSVSVFADTTWTGGDGDWSNASNWSAGVPATSGDSITFGASGDVTSTIDSSWATAGAVDGLVFSADEHEYTIDQGDGVTSLSIGSGGISGSKTDGLVRLNGSYNLTADQEWGVGSPINLYADLSGTGNLTLSGSTRFYSGSSDSYTGQITIAPSTTVSLWNESQLNRLGETVVLNDSGAIYMPITLGGSSMNMSTDINFNDLTSAGFTLSHLSNSAGNLILDGDWTGSVSGHSKTLALSGVSTPIDDFRLVIAGDNSGFTSAVSETSTNGYGGLTVKSTFVQLTSDNALGSNNSIYTVVGDGQGSNKISGLFTTDGHDVTAKIGIKSSWNGSGGEAYLGLDGSGQATYSGNVELQSRDTGGVVNALHLTADAGGSVTFSGNIYNADDANTIKLSHINIEGGGSVIFEGDNTYTATTTVATDTTLFANNTTGSATGTGAVIVQDGATLGGTGRIAAGLANGITAQSGATFAPGASIGSLILDGGNTTGPVLTMEAGATFEFELGPGNTSDQILLWNYSDGDLVLNDNIINFSDAQEGTYTLFEFYGDNGDNTIASNLTEGLVIGTGLEAYSYTLNYNSDSITLDIIPEPSSFALVIGAIALFMTNRRRTR